MKERILFIRRSAAFGGIEVLLMDWISSVDFGKCAVTVASTMDCYSDKIADKGLPVSYETFSLPVMGNPWEIYRSWSRDIRKVSPDKVVFLEGRVDEIPLSAVLAGYAAARGNVYMTEHLAWPEPPERTRSTHFGFLPGVGLWWYRLMWGVRIRSYLSRRILAVSEAVRNTLLSYGYPKEKIAIAYHGVDVERFSPSPANKIRWRREHGIPEEACVIVSTARLAREKRLERLIRAFQISSRDRQDLWLLIAGDGPLRKELEDSANSTGAGDRIRFLGLVDDVPGLLQASDLFVLPSDREGLSVSLTEAMSVGLICIATDIPGSEEVIRNDENGFLVEPDDRGVFEGLEKALKMDDRRRRDVADKARATVMNIFEKKKSIGNIFRLLEIG
ncbi:MAG: glycosyltransferase [Deltaproteobacteria bacterium]|nr:MAG: glycosyltransferase [Deltaproteobacteria bacterium]